jgi:transcriptional regulator of nitric oxide reductase
VKEGYIVTRKLVKLLLFLTSFHGIQNSRVNNMSNIDIIHKANTKWSVGKHGPPTKVKVGAETTVRYTGLPVVRASMKMTVS